MFVCSNIHFSQNGMPVDAFAEEAIKSALLDSVDSMKKQVSFQIQPITCT